MNEKRFLVSGTIAGIAFFLLGWLFYGIIFKDFFLKNENENMLFIFLGCMTLGFFLSYIFTKWTGIVRLNTGLFTGATIGLFIGLYTNFVFYSMTNAVPYKTMGIDIAITIITSAIVGAIIAVCNSKIK
jgi:hypothetical protein